ncbi:ESX secretion-associated protein EspG [Prauserella cavernicola]|uniref:ESX secretion-associated protein EspG n=1 Tax=Prauserella cavernicola TaxID=2800127 RepID=A0A934V4L7_9PSEU|nr:ESX secretion-associated protein EspG [Prauserella cavernicola]MBK1788516.1 ESX secretion-associated protein EspG [Prauserella cavernicola]
MPVLTRPITVPRAVLLYLWELEQLGDAHPVLGGFDLFVPQDARGDFTRECFRALTELGLAQNGALTRDFRVVLRVLASSDRELYCWSAHADDRLDRKLLASASGGEAVAMQVRGETVSIVPIDERRLVEEFVEELPRVPAAPVRELAVATRDFEARHELGDPLDSGPNPAKELAKQLAAPRDAVHQVYAAGVADGRFRRSKPFSVIDVRDEGRVLVFADGQDNLRRLPGTPANLAKTLVATWRSM